MTCSCKKWKDFHLVGEKYVVSKLIWGWEWRMCFLNCDVSLFSENSGYFNSKSKKFKFLQRQHDSRFQSRGILNLFSEKQSTNFYGKCQMNWTLNFWWFSFGLNRENSILWMSKPMNIQLYQEKITSFRLRSEYFFIFLSEGIPFWICGKTKNFGYKVTEFFNHSHKTAGELLREVKNVIIC